MNRRGGALAKLTTKFIAGDRGITTANSSPMGRAANHVCILSAASYLQAANGCTRFPTSTKTTITLAG